MRIFVSPNRQDSDIFEVREKGARLRKLCREFGARPTAEDSESFTVEFKPNTSKENLAQFLELAGARGVAITVEDARMLSHEDPLGEKAIAAEISAKDFDGLSTVDELGAKLDYVSEAIWRVPAEYPEAQTFDALLEQVEAPVAEPTPQADPWDAALAQTPEEAELERRLLDQNLAACNADPRGIIRY